MKLSLKYLLTIVLILFFPVQAYALYDPLSVPNNKYGIHIADLNDISGISALVNSRGGDWGYVTIVIQDGQKHKSLWQDLFNRMRRSHLIPIIRIATHVEGETWSVPQKVDADSWVDFLNDLNWPVENRYVILFNEPNHANEWGGTVNPENYAEIFTEYAAKLKARNGDFFILPAALDVSAANTDKSMDANIFWRRVFLSKPEYLKLVDGWNSHSYPNPEFSGLPYASGRGTLKSYQWELNLLGKYGLDRHLPVFITETGWKHNQGKNIDYNLLNPLTVSEYLRYASEKVWTDPDIVAVTPFVFNYQDYPFDHFSWKMIGSDEFYPFYDEYRNISKTRGDPKQHESYRMLTQMFPISLVSDSIYEFKTSIQNDGQNILDQENGYLLNFTSKDNKLVFTPQKLPVLEPGQSGSLSYIVKTPDETGKFTVSAKLGKNDGYISLGEAEISVVPPPSLTVTAKLGWKQNSSATDAGILVYDADGKIIHAFRDIEMNRGKVLADKLKDIIPGNKYRIVLIVPGYLPRQSISPLTGRNSPVTMKRLLPFDFNRDGALNYKDFPAVFKYSFRDILQLFF